VDSFTAWELREAYRKVETLEDRPSQVTNLIDWELVRPLLEEMYNNKTERGERPNFDVM